LTRIVGGPSGLPPGFRPAWPLGFNPLEPVPRRARKLMADS